MASICRSSIMKVFNSVIRGLCLLVLMLGLCTLSGCGEEQDEERHSRREPRVEADDESGISQGDQDESKELQSGQDREDPGEDADSDTKEPVTMAQLLNEMNGSGSAEGEALSDTVLWFNATYAPLTYSNGGNWRLVGGMEPSYYNERLEKVLLERDWDVVDRESAVETIEWLREEGHRETFRNYRQELEEMELLDVDADVFLEAITSTEMEGYLFRYVIVYSLYQSGLDEDAIAAWDLCRINQLCGDFYICGYLTYEEAMDISLENSLVLQKKYDSWDELVNSYMLGYQFWKSDPCTTEDSPTLQRYQYYEMLLEMLDGPYELDWNMELKKDW